MRLSIIIVNYNVKYFLEQCLCAVVKGIATIDAEVWVVDNNSTDGSIAYLQPKYPQVHFIANTINMGFGKANNMALAQCTGEMVLFLNPDTIIAEDTLQICIDFFMAKPTVGALGVKMLDGSGHFLPESKRAFPAPGVAFFKMCGLAQIFSKSAIFNRYALGHLMEDGIHKVDVLCGAFMMVRKTVLENVGAFDEAFFMYGEDIDLSYRINQIGAGVFYLGNTSIIHFKGESARKGKLNYVRIFYQAMVVFVNKHYTGAFAIIMKLLLKAGIYSRALLSLIMAPVRLFANALRSSRNEMQTNYLLVGDKTSTANAANILRQYQSNASFQSIETLDKLPTNNEIIVLCTGGLTYSAAIECLAKQKKAGLFLWHGAATSSIVGSQHGKSTGIVYNAT